MRASDIDIDTASAARRAWIAHCIALGALGAWPFAARAAAPRKLLVLGDSLSAEYGLERGTGWVALLQARIERERLPVAVINASISGETTSGGRTRLPALLTQHDPDVVVLELGANDALRGLPLTMTQANLAAMAAAAKTAGARVLIVGLALPPNYGRKYAEEFVALFGNVARDQGAALVPFLLAGVADVPQAEANFQSDRIHPTARAQPQMLANVWPVLQPMLKR